MRKHVHLTLVLSGAWRGDATAETSGWDTVYRRRHTRPSPATTPTRIDILGLLCVTPKTADCTREQLTSSGLSSITPDCSIKAVACKTSAAKAFDSEDVADAFATCKRMIQGIGWLLDSEQARPILWIDDDAESDSTNQGCSSDFMLDDISDMAPSHAQFCEVCSEVACRVDCLHSRAGLSTAGHALDAFCSEKLKNVRGLKAPLLEREQLLGFNCRWSMHDRGHYVGNMFYDGNKASMAMRQYFQNLGVTERFEQAKISSSSPGTFRTIKHLSDLVTQLLSLFPYAALLMTSRPSEPERQSLTEADVLKDIASPEYTITRALDLNGPQATTKCLTIVEHFAPLGDPG